MKNDSDHSQPKTRSLNLGGRLWKIFLGSLLVIVGWALTTYLWNSYQRAAAMDSWAEVPCEILSGTIDDSQRNQRGMPKYELQITYSYRYQDKDYESERFKRLATEASDVRKVNSKLKDFPVGLQTVCYVNPEEPSFAVLKKDSKAALYSIWFPCLFVVGGAGIILTALFRR